MKTLRFFCNSDYSLFFYSSCRESFFLESFWFFIHCTDMTVDNATAEWNELPGKTNKRVCLLLWERQTRIKGNKDKDFKEGKSSLWLRTQRESAAVDRRAGQKSNLSVSFVFGMKELDSISNAYLKIAFNASSRLLESSVAPEIASTSTF